MKCQYGDGHKTALLAVFTLLFLQNKDGLQHTYVHRHNVQVICPSILFGCNIHYNSFKNVQTCVHTQEDYCNPLPTLGLITIMILTDFSYYSTCSS